MRYKNFLYLSQRYKKELNKKTPCKFSCSIFHISCIPFSDGFSFLEKHYKERIRLHEFYKGVYQRKQASRKVRTSTIKDINENLDFYKRCLMLLDFYKKV